MFPGMMNNMNYNNNNMNMMNNNNNINMMNNNNRNMNMMNNNNRNMNMMNNNNRNMNMMNNNNINMNLMNNFNMNMMNNNNMNMMNNNMNMINNIDMNQYKFILSLMLLLNPSLNINNQNNLNNMMNNFMNANPYFFQINNNNQQSNNQNNNSRIEIINQNDENINSSKKGGILPRKNTDNIQNEIKIDSFPGNFNSRINIVFLTGVGMKFSINTPINVSIKELFIAFIHRVNLDESVLGKMIYFLYNGKRIQVDLMETVIDYGLQDGSKIIVVDASNLIGGKYNKNE